MATTKRKSASTRKKNDIFISWSGENSQTFAKALKKVLEETIFSGTDLNCFVSDVDIASGSDWWLKIKSELKACQQGILCITKENIHAPWLYFEAGAMIARDIPTIPLLVSCSVSSLNGTPLKSNQCVIFYDQQKFQKMIWDINEKMHLLSINRGQLDVLAKAGYDRLKVELEPVLKQLTTIRLFNTVYTYPPRITTINKGTVYLSAPMASISDAEYDELLKGLPMIHEALKDMGFQRIYCSALSKPKDGRFSGQARAIQDNFVALKQVDCMVIVYPWDYPSSVLVEIGYGIALCKKMVIFYRGKLPYMLERAGESINHVKSYPFKDYDDIKKVLSTNGMALFDGDTDE